MTSGRRGWLARHRISATIAVGIVVAALPAAWGVDRFTRTAPATLVVLTSWTDTGEASAFQAVVDDFQKAMHGTIQVEIESSRDENEVLQSGIQNGDPPDLAVLPNPGALQQYVSEGYVKALDDLQDRSLSRQISGDLEHDFGPLWNRVVDAGTGHPYALVVKADVKSLIWYGPGVRAPAPAPADWDQLLAYGDSVARPGAAPWCIGLSDVSTAGWPGTDWIEDILLQQSGSTVYDEWVDGDRAASWNSAPVSAAWQRWGQLLAGAGQVYGGDLNALAMPAGDTDDPMFAPAGPACELSHGASLETGSGVAATSGEYGDFPFPGAAADRTYEVSADVMGIFHDTPQAEQFAAYLAGPTGQEIWPQHQKDSAFSADTAPAVLDKLSSVYAGDKIAAGIEKILTDKTATLCYDASDLMPPAMEAAFERAVLEYVSDPGRLPSILDELATVRNGAYPRTYGLTGCSSGN